MSMIEPTFIFSAKFGDQILGNFEVIPKIGVQAESVFVFLFPFILILAMIYLFFARYRRQIMTYIVTPIQKMISETEKISLPNERFQFDSTIDDLAILKKNLNEMLNRFDETAKENSELQKLVAAGELARQVAHDIRSPLSALNMVSATLFEISEDKRLLIRNATHRINDIANNLLQKSRSYPFPSQSLELNNTNMEPEPIMLSALLDSVVSEKRVQYRERIEVEIQANIYGGYGLFSKINSSEFTRALSNLINNSVEAITGQGHVTIGISGNHHNISIIILDNGQGIPPQILSRIGQRGVSQGKDNSADGSGSGLGLFHARQTVEKVGGKLLIQSQVGKGTVITVTLPRCMTPSWFVEKISLKPSTTVISIDDDQTIHQIWHERLNSVTTPNLNIKHQIFSSPEKVEAWVHQNISIQKLFLVDYEFLDQSTNGLEIIERSGIAKQAILVTSRYEENYVREWAKKIGVKIIPKALAPLVPIEITHDNPA